MRQALSTKHQAPCDKRGKTMSEYSIFTSESVSEGHPDKVADQISDAVLDAIIARDPHARVAVETLVKTGMAIIAGELTTTCYVDLEDRSEERRVGKECRTQWSAYY